MKKTTIFFIFTLFINVLSFAQTHIPDKNFANAIRWNYSDCIDGNDNLTAAAANLENLSVFQENIKSLEGIQGFTNLKSLDCSANLLISLPALPPSLTRLHCYSNKLVSLPVLPPSLIWLECSANQLVSLPALPPSLIGLECRWNQLINLPTLPASLTRLHCYSNKLVSLPFLPQSLTTLMCDNNQLVSLPVLPQSLTELDCSHNEKLTCINSFLPANLSFLDVSSTSIKCLPNKPTWINTTLPICDATNSGTCFDFPKITGNVFLDYNDDGIKNNDDVFVSNQMIEIKPYGFALTNSKGDFIQASDTSQSITIKLKEISNNFDIKPNERSLKTTSSFAQSYDNQDFRLVPKQTFGDMEVSIVSSVQRPGFEGTLTLTYRNIGTTVLFGQIKLEKDPILTYLSAVPKENAIDGHTIIWDYSDLKPFESRVITVRVKVPTTTPINTKLTNKMFASYNVLNNYYETEKVAELTTVVGSYDPNDKTASVKNIDPQDIIERKPITYTIRFQNTGNYHAERVEIQDTISANFDLSTFKNIAVSHPNCTVSFEKDRFKAGQPTVIKWTFEPIFLPDSTANEPASHGFVRFSIQPKQGLPIGTALDNKAYIYFDFNLPIITNTSTVKVEKTIKVKQIATEIPLKVYPNPSNDRLFVETSEELNGEFVLTNLLGQVIEYQSNNSTGTTVFDLQHLPKGVYVLTLKTEEGSVSRKVMKE